MKKTDVRDIKELLGSSIQEYSASIKDYEHNLNPNHRIHEIKARCNTLYAQFVSVTEQYKPIDGDEVFLRRLRGEVKSSGEQLAYLDRCYKEVQLKSDINGMAINPIKRPKALTEAEDGNRVGGYDRDADRETSNPIREALESIIGQGQANIASIRLQELRLKGVRRIGIDIKENIGSRIYALLGAIGQAKNRDRVIIWSVVGVLSAISVLYASFR